MYAGSAIDSNLLNAQKLTLIRVSYVIMLYISSVGSGTMLCMHNVSIPLHDHSMMY